MTLVVCRKIDDDIFIHSDSKIIEDVGTGSERELRQNRPLCGLLKTLILHPHICVSFAGSTHQVTEFLKTFLQSDLNEWNTDKLISNLFQIHSESEGQCDFIICESVDRSPVITSIKDMKVQTNLSSAWIGSHRAFAKFQAAFHTQSAGADHQRMRSAFRAVIEDPAVPEVGHFHIAAYLDHHICDDRGDSVFLYEWIQETDIGSEVQHVPAGVWTTLITGKAECGAYGTSYFRSVSTKRHAVAIHFPHARLGILLCPQIDCERPVRFLDCDAVGLLKDIWENHSVAMEGMALCPDGRHRFLRNYR